MPTVLDASAMIAYLRGEPGADEVRRSLALEPPNCLAHSVNLCEVFYDFLKTGEEKSAQTALDDLRSVGLIVREDMDEAFATPLTRPDPGTPPATRGVTRKRSKRW